MLKSRAKKLVQFTLFYGISILLLFIISIAYNMLTLPDVAVWKTHNPDRAFFAERFSVSKSKIKYTYQPIQSVPQILIDCFVLSEDAAFYVHDGFDWFEFRQSLLRNIRQKKFSRGASTITQQVVKNLFLSKDKKISRKIREYLITREIEEILKKRRILELYINIAEFDRNLFGIRAAAYHYFQKEVDQLTLAEMVQLVATLPSPKKLDPTNINKGLKWRCRVITERLYFYEKIDEQQYLQLKSIYHK